MKPKVLILTGPTAVGKTELSIALAKRFGAEIISADSMQIYQGMNIGTAKITPQEMQGVVHHMLDIVPVTHSYSVAEYQSAAFSLIDRLLQQKKLPMVVGGTGLYIHSLMYDVDFSSAAADTSLRKTLEALSNEELHERLQQLDAASAARIHQNDKKRMIRRLEVLAHGCSTEFDFRKKNDRYDFILIGITDQRDVLYQNINRRVDQMVAMGLCDEARLLYDRYGEALTALKAIGYKEWIPYFQGSATKAEAIEAIKQNTRRYAKRQLTWFRREEAITWFDKSRLAAPDALFSEITAYLEQRMNEYGTES